MSAYLKNLAAKNLQIAEVIRPRLPSIFEPERLQMRRTFDPSPEPVNDKVRDFRSFRIGDDAGMKSEPGPVFPATDRSSDPSTSALSFSNEPDMRRVARDERKELKWPSPFGSYKLPAGDAGSDRTDPLRIKTETTTPPDLFASFQVPVANRNALSPGRDQEEKKRIGPENRISGEAFAPLLISGDTAASRQREIEESIWNNVPNGGVSPALRAAAETAVGLEERTMSDRSKAPSSVEEKKMRSIPGQGIKHEIRDKAPGWQWMKNGPGFVSAVVRPTVRIHTGREGNARGEWMAKAEIKSEVQVTIGRIEVKAAPTAAISQRKRNRLPEMSLDEYLKGKRGSS